MAGVRSLSGAAQAIAQGADPRTVAAEAAGWRSGSQRAVKEGERSVGADGDAGPGNVTSTGVADGPREDGMDPSDFPAAREQGGNPDTVMAQQTVSLLEAGEVLNRSRLRRVNGQKVHAICPMVMPRGRSFLSMLPVSLLLVLGVVGSSVAGAVGDGQVLGYNVSVGGGMGATHGDPETYPRLGDVIESVGADRVLFASDYPHWDATFPGVTKMILDRKDMNTDTKRKVMGENAARLLRLD